jgi:hypothetical protein
LTNDFSGKLLEDGCEIINVELFATDSFICTGITYKEKQETPEPKVVESEAQQTTIEPKSVRTKK